jgi:hypothetical protein
MILEHGWLPYEKPQPDELTLALTNKKWEINQYDKSDNVNVFYINDMAIWLD